ncbi:MAG TPA: 3-keto-5-aminohexanoate cleavage protein [Trebonia sp.]|jgi:uncharacterized protein (DUF849 family)
MLIQAALNGGTPRSEHPNVPLTPAELADSARAAQVAGATMFHIHPRDTYGAQTLEAEYVLPAVAAVRAVTGLKVSVTTAIWAVNGDIRRRLSLVTEWDGPGRPDFASVNMNEPGIDELADRLGILGIGIEAGVWTVDDARTLGSRSFRRRIVRAVLEPVERTPAAAVATAAEASAELARLGIDVPQVHHGYASATWDVIKTAAADGVGIRIGLEDTTVLPDGTQARGNADLVSAAVSLIG